jgi:hypothetical protein
MDPRLPERLSRRVSPEPNTACWIWLGPICDKGYGRTTAPDGRSALAHRLFFSIFVGEIPKGLVLDHLCRQRCCVNPAHLEPVTTAENNRRSPLLAEFYRTGGGRSLMTGCGKAGHPFVLRADGRQRKCRTCQIEYGRARRRALKGAA